MPTVAMMDEEELEKLEESGGLKVATLAARRREMEFFMTYWKEEGKEDLEEVFKTPEGCTKFSKLLGRFDWRILLSKQLSCFLSDTSSSTVWPRMVARLCPSARLPRL